MVGLVSDYPVLKQYGNLSDLHSEIYDDIVTIHVSYHDFSGLVLGFDQLSKAFSDGLIKPCL